MGFKDARKKIVPFLREKLGLAGSIILVLSAFVGASTFMYYFTGIGGLPKVGLRAVSRENDVVLVVENGSIPHQDWEYQVYSEASNPPLQGTSTLEDLEPGKEIVLESGLPPGTYIVRIWHKPSSTFIYETKLRVGG